MNCPVSEIFDVRYGHSLELNALEQSDRENGVAFVSRRMGQNGISAYVAPIDELIPAPAGTFRVPSEGMASLQPISKRLTSTVATMSPSFDEKLL